jgi:hypothetical protein
VGHLSDNPMTHRFVCEKDSDKEEKETKEQGSFETCSLFWTNQLVRENECFVNRGIGLGHCPGPCSTRCTTMAQANAHADGLQPASFQELYASMPDVLN